MIFFHRNEMRKLTFGLILVLSHCEGMSSKARDK